MFFIIRYFQLCDDQCPSNLSCWRTSPYYFCLFNNAIVLLFPLLVLIKLTILLFKKRGNCASLSFKDSFRQSIFLYREKDNPRQSYFLYLLMVYGMFFIRPLGAVIFTLLVDFMDQSLAADW